MPITEDETPTAEDPQHLPDPTVHDIHEVHPPESPDAPDPAGAADLSGPGNPSDRLERIIESVLFAAGAPVPLKKLVDVLGTTGPRPSVKEAQAAVLALQERYATDQRGIRLHEVAGGYQFRTARENAEWVRVLFREKPARLGRATLETLAIVAYKQPVTRAEIEAIRGVDVDGVLNTLLARKLVKIAGRKEAVGRPLLYGTTPEFLETFGLKSLDELPALHELGPLTDGEEPAPPSSEDSAGTSGDAGAAGQTAAAAADAPVGDAGAEAALAETGPDPVAAGEPAAGGGAAGTSAEDPLPGGDCVAAGGGDDDHGGAGTGERADGDGTGGEGGPPPRPDHG